MLVYSIILIIVMLFKPSGLMGEREFSLGGLFRLLSGKRRERTVQTGKGD